MLDCDAWPVFYPYMASESTMRFCGKFSRNNIACVGEIKTNCLRHSADHHMVWKNRFVKLESLPISFDFSFAVYKELV